MNYPRFFCGIIPLRDNSKIHMPKLHKSVELWSGERPLWISGKWHNRDVTVFSEMSTNIALIGSCLTSEKTIKAHLKEVAANNGDFDSLMNLSGNYSVVAHDRDRSCIFADTSGLNKVYYFISNSFIIYSSFSIAIQQLFEIDLNPTWLVTNLIGDCMPEVSYHTSPFQDVKTVPPGHYLEVSSNEINCRRYWDVPEAEFDLIQTSKILKHQLDRGIKFRSDNFSNITSDLSGGLDSTSLSLLSARYLLEQGKCISTVTVKSLSKNNSEDEARANYAASLYPNIKAHFFSTQDLPSYWSNLDEATLTDEPFRDISKLGQYKNKMSFLNQLGSQVHLSGDGADTIFSASPSYLSDILKQGKLFRFLKHAYGSSRIWNLSLFLLLKTSIRLSFDSYQNWIYKQMRFVELRKKATYLEDSLGMGWSGSPSIASWYTEKSVDLFYIALSDYARNASPLFSVALGQSFSISELHTMGSSCRILQQIGEQYGVSLNFPYLESEIIDTCLSTNTDEIFSPFIYKPLLQAILQDEIPSAAIKKNNAGDYTFDYLRGMQENINFIQHLFNGSILHEMNIIDDEKIKSCLMKINVGVLDDLRNLNNTIALEIWLRQLLHHSKENKIWMK